MSLMQLFHVIVLQRVENDEPLTLEQQDIIGHEFVSHGGEWPQPRPCGNFFDESGQPALMTSDRRLVVE